MFTKLYILLSPILSWSLLLIIAFILFGGIDIPWIIIPNLIIYLVFVIIFFLSASGCLLYYSITRQQGFTKTLLYFFAIVPNVILLLLLTGELMSNISYLTIVNSITSRLTDKLLTFWFFAFITYLFIRFWQR